MKIKMFQVDAFTSELFSGNPAAVCLLNEWLSDELMLSIASENNLSGTNTCQISIHQPGNANRIVLLVVEDNLTKGASGQAIQCMNIMFSYAESDGLAGAALVP